MKNFILSIIFFLIKIVYYLYSMAQTFVTYSVKKIFFQLICDLKGTTKIRTIIDELQKKPTILTLVISPIDGIKQIQSNLLFQQNVKIMKQMLDLFLSLSFLQQINIFINTTPSLSNDGRATQMQKQLMKYLQKNQDLYTNERIKFVNKSSFDLKRVKGTPAPLIISCNTYQTVSYLPCEYLIDAEIYFAPPLLSSGLYDIFKGFQSYSNSKQRNGK